MAEESGLESLEPEGERSEAPAPGEAMEKAARGLMGAASGGVMGLVVSGLLGLGRPTEGGASITGMLGLTVLFAAGMGILNGRQKRIGLPAPPRAVVGVMLTSAALLITQAVFLIQSAHMPAVTGGGGHMELLSRSGLWVSLILVGLGVVAALLGWAEMATQKGKYGGGKWVAMSILAASAWAGLALACYNIGYGFVFAG